MNVIIRTLVENVQLHGRLKFSNLTFTWTKKHSNKHTRKNSPIKNKHLYQIQSHDTQSQSHDTQSQTYVTLAQIQV